MLDIEATRANTGSRSDVTFYRLSQAREAGAYGVGLVYGPCAASFCPAMLARQICKIWS